MDFDEKIENDSIGINSNEHNLNSDDNMYDKAAEILEKYKREAILEDNYSDLETQKFDITASDDYDEEQVNGHEPLSKSSRKYMERVEDDFWNLVTSNKFILIVCIFIVVMIVLDFLRTILLL